MLTKPSIGRSLLLLATIGFMACGGDDAPATGADRAAPAQDAAAAGTIPAAMQAFSDDGDVAVIAIEADDLMRFSTNQFSVRPGQMVRLTLTHIGSLPAQAMGHNVVILKAGDDALDFGTDVGVHGGSADNNFVPNELRDRVVAFTKMIGGGESATVEFQAPSEPGEHPFLCSFPGHFVQMTGVMRVE